MNAVLPLLCYYRMVLLGTLLGLLVLLVGLLRVVKIISPGQQKELVFSYKTRIIELREQAMSH